MDLLFLLFCSWPSAPFQAPEGPRPAPAAEERPAETWPVVLEGLVRAPDGAPAVGAVVLSSAGGQAVTDGEGRFRLALTLPIEADEVQLTAVRGATAPGLRTGVASLRVGGLSPGGPIAVGTLRLSSGTTCIPTWLPTFGQSAELNNVPFDMEVFDDGDGPAIYLAGLGGPVLRWSGSAWLPVGMLNRTATALQVFDAGNGPRLFVGGTFTVADGQPVTGLASWDGTAWTGSPVFENDDQFQVLCLAIHDDGSGPTLYAGGAFEDVIDGVPVQHLVRLENGAWRGVGGGLGNGISSLESCDEPGGPRLFAVEAFLVGTEPRQRVDRWDGTSWTLGVGGFQTVSGETLYDLQAFDDGSGGGPALYVGGVFTQAGGTPANGVARWDGTSWSAVGAGPGFTVFKLGPFDPGSGPVLLAGGSGLLSEWSGVAWGPPQEMLTVGATVDLQSFDDGSGAVLLVCQQGPTNLQPNVTVSRWDGQEFRALGPWLNGGVGALLPVGPGLGLDPGLYVGGFFTIAGGGSAHGIARYDGNSWSSLTSGVGGPRANVAALELFDDGGGPALYAAGEFETAGGQPALNVARWDGSGWSPVGGGTNGIVTGLEVYDDGQGGGPALYACGLFTLAGGVSCPFLARWNGTVWSPLGAGVTDFVFALTVHDDGQGGGPALYAGGRFTVAGGAPAARIARWNGLAWSPVGAGMNNQVQTFAVFDDGLGDGPVLYAGGTFTNAGVQARRIARWNGTAWSQPSGGVNNAVRALTVHDDGTGGGPALFVGGTFSTAGGLAAPLLAKWNGTSWSAIPGGPTSGSTEELASSDVAGVPELYAAGGFGTGFDSFLARIGCDTTPPVLDCPVTVRVSTVGLSGRAVSFAVGATDDTDPAPVVVCTPPSGSVFPLGSTMVQCTATDLSGNEASCSFEVVVERRVRLR